MDSLRPDVAAFVGRFTTPATVTPKGGAAMPADVDWYQEDAEPAELQLGVAPSSSVNRRQVAWVRRDQVPDLPRDSTIFGGPEHPHRAWRVHSVNGGGPGLGADPDYHIAVVV